MNIYKITCVYVCVYMHICIFTYVQLYVRIHSHIHTYSICVYICIRMHICDIYIFVLYIHTYVQIPIICNVELNKPYDRGPYEPCDNSNFGPLRYNTHTPCVPKRCCFILSIHQLLLTSTTTFSSSSSQLFIPFFLKPQEGVGAIHTHVCERE